MIKLYLIYLKQSLVCGFDSCFNNFQNWDILMFDDEFKKLIEMSDDRCGVYFWYWMNIKSASFKQWLRFRGIK